MKFLESIFVKNKKIENLYFHQLRIQKAQKEYDLIENDLIKNDLIKNNAKNWVFDLHNILQKFVDDYFENIVFKNDFLNENRVEKHLENQIYKLRLLYEKEIEFLELVPYFPKNIQKLALVDIGDYSYNHKYTDRNMLNSFLEQKKTEIFTSQKQEIDEIILVKNNQLTDTTYSNIIWTNDLKNWYSTPFPLLEGTFRTKLLSENKIFLKEITLQNYKDFSHFKLINALLQDQLPVLEINKIV